MKSEFYDYHKDKNLEFIHDRHEETVIFHEEERKDFHMVEIVNREGVFRGFGKTEQTAEKSAIETYIDRVGKSEGMTV